MALLDQLAHAFDIYIILLEPMFSPHDAAELSENGVKFVKLTNWDAKELLSKHTRPSSAVMVKVHNVRQDKLS